MAAPALKTAPVDATEQADAEAPTPLTDLLTDEAGHSGVWELRVFRNDLTEYAYTGRGGAQVTTKKLQLVLLSQNPAHYCLGVARIQKNDHNELRQQKDHFFVGSTWKFSKITLLTSEKAQYIHTGCRVVIDLRKSKAVALLQSMSLPTTPSPSTTIADILQLRKQQRFDIMAIPAAVLNRRRSGAGQVIADIRLIDGSKDKRTSDEAVAALPLTLFFANDTEFEAFEAHVGCNPLLFMALNGYVADDRTVQVRTVKKVSWWQLAGGPKHDAMKKAAVALCDANTAAADVVALPTFAPTEAADYTDAMATLTACSLLDDKKTLLEESATEHLYQLNHVYVPAPTLSHNVTYEGRLFAVFDCWDFSKKIQLAFRAKAMLALAGLDSSTSAATYQTAVAQGELRHPLMTSLRVRVKKNTGQSQIDATEPSQGASQIDATEPSQLGQAHSHSTRDLAAIVVEAAPLSTADIPNDSVDAIFGLLAAAGPLTSERLVVATLADVAPSPFYNMTVAGEPAEKALVMLRFTQRPVGSLVTNGFRLVTDNVASASDAETQRSTYGAIARCTVERSPEFMAQKGDMAMAILSKVSAPCKAQHAADLYIETMCVVRKEEHSAAATIIAKLRAVSASSVAEMPASQESAWQQRKCRRLTRYPTMAS